MVVIPSDLRLLHNWTSCNWPAPSGRSIDVVVVAGMRVVVAHDGVSLSTWNSSRATVEIRFDGMIFNGVVVEIQLPSLLLRSHCCCWPAPVVVVVAVAPGDVGMDVVVGGPGVVRLVLLRITAAASAGD